MSIGCAFPMQRWKQLNQGAPWLLKHKEHEPFMHTQPELDNDDLPIGRVLSRREVLTLLGTASLGLLVGCGPTEVGVTATAQPAVTAVVNAEAASAVALQGNPTAAASAVAEVSTAAAMNSAVATPNCVVRPEVNEGPYYVDEDLVRSDIRSDPTTNVVKEGALLALTFSVSRVAGGGCTPLANAEVEIWHCDAAGVYSDVNDPSFSTVGQKWLRGSQMTDANGMATFSTIYPGWYGGRCVHIHFKVRPTTATAFTSQLFFDEAFTDQVFTQAPYAAKGQRDTLNSGDGSYRNGGSQLLLNATSTAQGYAATFPIGIDLSTIGSTSNGGMGGPGGAPPGGSPPPRGMGGPTGPRPTQAR